MQDNKKDKQSREDSARHAATATARALAGKSLKLTFANTLYTGIPLFAPLPAATPGKPDETPAAELRWALGGNDSGTINSLRALTDMAAFHRRYHDPALNTAHRPADTRAGSVFDMLERARCDSAGAQAFPGGGENLRRHFNERTPGAPLGAGMIAHPEIESAAWYFLIRKTMSGAEPPARFATVTNELRAKIRGMGLGRDLTRLQSLAGDQAGFARAANTLLAALGHDVTPEPPPAAEETAVPARPADKDRTGKAQKTPAAKAPAKPTGTDAPDPAEDEDPEPADDVDDTRAPRRDDSKREAERPGKPESNPDSTAIPRPHSRAGEPPQDYRAYTRDFDQIIHANQIYVSSQNMAASRARMDNVAQKNRHVVGRLANRLQRKLLAREASILRCETDLEEGIIDPTRLTRIITDPSGARAYKRETDVENRNTIVTLLIDNSGSMRGNAILTAAVSAEILAQTLERCGVKTEILGFTTRAWKGGQSAEKWRRAGAPQNPGRLNDLRHIIYKTADAPVRGIRQNMAVMAHGEELLKENIDGEALEWAYSRLLARTEKRRILIVLSDGTPADDETNGKNRGPILENHLRKVIARIQNERAVELLAIGIGHDVRKFYDNAITLPGSDNLGEVLLAQADKLFETPQQPRRRGWHGPRPRL
jgi:cobaltochelatase CobT